MKKAFLIGIYSLLLINLYATTFKSNAIGQNLGVYNEDSEYYLIEKVDNSITEKKLYRNDILLQTTNIEIKDNIKTINYDDLSILNIKTFLNNLIISEIEGNLSINYNYENNQLESKVVSQDKEIKEVYKYYYSVDNKLLGILKIHNDNNILSTFDIKKEYQSLNISDLTTYKKSQIHNGVINSVEYDNDTLINKIDVEKGDNDEIVLTQKNYNNIVKEYYYNGVLNKKETYNDNEQLINTYEFFYDENYLKTKIIQTENIYNKYTQSYDKIRSTISSYFENQLEQVKISENDILISSYYYSENNEKIENLYDNNMVYCTITYIDDKIIDIQYREVKDDL